MHLAGLLVDRKPLPQTPRLLPDVAQPTEELIDLEVGAFVFLRRSHQWILAAKEVPEGTVLLLIARANGRRNLVVAVRWLLRLRLHLLDQLRTWGNPIKDVNTQHLDNVFILEWLELACEDVALLPGVAQHRLGVGVGRPVGYGKLGLAIALHVCNCRILFVGIRSQRHERREPIHWVACLVKTVSCEESGVGSSKYPRLEFRGHAQMACLRMLPLPLFVFIAACRVTGRALITHLLVRPSERSSVEGFDEAILGVHVLIHLGGWAVAWIGIHTRDNDWFVVSGQWHPSCRHVQP